MRTDIKFNKLNLVLPTESVCMKVQIPSVDGMLELVNANIEKLERAVDEDNIYTILNALAIHKVVRALECAKILN